MNRYICIQQAPEFFFYEYLRLLIGTLQQSIRIGSRHIPNMVIIILAMYKYVDNEIFMYYKNA